MSRVLLHDNQLCERGTTNALVDYARALRGIGYETDLSYWRSSPANVDGVISRLADEFTLVPHDDQHSLGRVADDYQAAYFIKAGSDDGLLLPETHSFVHAVFQNYEPHGDRYAYVSSWLAHEMRRQVESRRGRREGRMTVGQAARSGGCLNALDFEYLNHIVDVPTPLPGMRQSLGLPDEAFVILRYGGYDTFDIPWVHSLVPQLLEENRNWHFIGVNTARFTTHPRARFLPPMLDSVEKVSLMRSADVFLSARSQGESFGLAIAEALQVGTPVLAWEGGSDRNHCVMLEGLKATYRSPRQLRRKLQHLASGQDSSSRQVRQARGDLFRPHAVLPHLIRQLGLQLSNSALSD